MEMIREIRKNKINEENIYYISLEVYYIVFDH